MKSFLDRYYEEVDDNLNDAAVAVRISKEKKLRLLDSFERQIWERLLTASGQESMIGYAEATITLKDNKEFYLLPGNFRQFLDFERRVNDNPNLLTNKLPSVPHYSLSAGIEILEGRRGFRIKPRPTLGANADWTLRYLKGTIILHNATVDGIGTNWVRGKPPGTDGGTLVKIDDYYKGSIIRIHDGDTGVPQERECTGSKADSQTFVVRHDWDPIPSGNLKYEISPTLPHPYDSLYALDVAIRILGRRARSGHRRELISERAQLWEACRNFFLSNVSDRGPSRILPVSADEPYSGYDPS